MGDSATENRIYLCIDLKTFYASVECADRGRDTLTCNLVVADPDRGRTTICLAVSAAMKRLGVRNRCRVFEIPDGIDYIMARPRMRHYMEVSARIYSIYLEYVSPDDIHVYSVDECFIDATPYLSLYRTTPRAFARELMDAVYARCGIRATAGIGTNLFLAKVALDITAKHVEDGIGYLDEELFRRTIWRHRPITDIWGIGPGIAARLAKYGAADLMGVAALDERILYREFGVTAEYLIDHAHGVEPCTIAEIHAYVPEATSLTSGQVLPRSYSYGEGRTVLREMVDASVLDLVDRRAVCDAISLYVGYADDTRERARIGRAGARGSGTAAGGCTRPTPCWPPPRHRRPPATRRRGGAGRRPGAARGTTGCGPGRPRAHPRGRWAPEGASSASTGRARSRGGGSTATPRRRGSWASARAPSSASWRASTPCTRRSWTPTAPSSA